MKRFYPTERVGSNMIPLALLFCIYESIYDYVFPFDMIKLAPIAAVPTFAIND